jgi:hypothetical protein
MQSASLSAGSHRRVLSLEPRSALRIRLRDGEALLHREDPLFRTLRVQRLDGEGRVTLNALVTESLLELSAPGLYEISFEDVGDVRYFPPPPQRIELRAGHVTDLEIPLQRR